MDPIGFAVFGAIAVALAAIAVTSMRRERKIQAGFTELAARRAMTYRYSPGQGRTAPKSEFLDPRHGLTVTVTRKMRKGSGDNSSETAGSTMAMLPDPRLPGGLAVYAPKAPAGLGAAATKMMGLFDNSIARTLLSRWLGDEIGQHLGTLQDFPPPAGTSLTIMANSDPNLFFDATKIARAIEHAPRGRDQHTSTMVMLSETGMKLRVGRDLTDAADIDALIAVALKLQADLTGPQAQPRSSN